LKLKILFYKIFNHTTIDSNEINIDLDNVIKWLQIKKQSAKHTLTKSYKKNIDYQIKRVINKIVLEQSDLDEYGVKGMWKPIYNN
jgi:hypothetical protein